MLFSLIKEEIYEPYNFIEEILSKNIPGILQYSDEFPGFLIRITGPYKSRIKSQYLMKVSCVEPRILRMISILINGNKFVKYFRLIEPSVIANPFYITLGRGIVVKQNLNNTFFILPVEAYNLLYKNKIRSENVKENFNALNMNLKNIPSQYGKVVTGIIKFKKESDEFDDYLKFIEIQGIGDYKKIGFGNIKIRSEKEVENRRAF